MNPTVRVDDGEGWRPKGERSTIKVNCAFCECMMDLYPNLQGLKGPDLVIYKKHLRVAHGLAPELSP